MCNKMKLFHLLKPKKRTNADIPKSVPTWDYPVRGLGLHFAEGLRRRGRPGQKLEWPWRWSQCARSGHRF